MIIDHRQGYRMSAAGLDGLSAVRALIQLDIDGADGDGAKLRKACHSDARMFGHTGAASASAQRARATS